MPEVLKCDRCGKEYTDQASIDWQKLRPISGRKHAEGMALNHGE